MNDKSGREPGRRMVERTDPAKWHRIAEAMCWAPEDEVPSWMTPDERAWFWREVAEGARQAAVDREMARLRADLEAMFSAPLLWLGAVIGRVMTWFRR